MSQNQNGLPKRKFGLLTTVAMIAGIVIGSGVFFQTPKVIRAVNGNVWYGALGYVIVAIAIIFGGLTISQYARKDENVGGVVTYCEMAWGKTMGFMAGWFQTFFYYPALVAVIAWVAASFTYALFGLPNLLTNPGAYVGDIANYWPGLWCLTLGFIALFFALNIFKTKLAGGFQSFSLVAKLSALIVLAVAGIVFGKPAELIATAGNYPGTAAGLFAVLGAIAFSYDGWLVAPSIAHEIKDPKKNLTKALVLAPLLITAVYLAYFIGLCAYVGPQAILDGADPTSILASSLFGNVGMKVILAFVVVSISGTLNGLVLGYIRLPYALAVRKNIIGYKQLAKLNAKLDIPVVSALFCVVISLVWLFLHFAAVDANIMWGWKFVEGLEIDVLPIILMYLFYIVLYVGVILKGDLSESANPIEKYVYPILASLGALIVIYGAFTKPQFSIYLIVSIIGIGAGLLLRPKDRV